MCKEANALYMAMDTRHRTGATVPVDRHGVLKGVMKKS